LFLNHLRFGLPFAYLLRLWVNNRGQTGRDSIFLASPRFFSALW